MPKLGVGPSLMGGLITRRRLARGERLPEGGGVGKVKVGQPANAKLHTHHLAIAYPHSGSSQHRQTNAFGWYFKLT